VSFQITEVIHYINTFISRLFYLLHIHFMKKYLILLNLQLLSAFSFSQLSVGNLSCDNRTGPLGIGNVQPRFSWQLYSAERNTMQTYYEVEVGTSVSSLEDNKHLDWKSGKSHSGQSVRVIYQGRSLTSNQKYFWRVRVWDNHDHVSSWSTPAFFQMGLLKESDWKAHWIEPGYTEDSINRPSPLFRKEFSLDKKVFSATAYITAHGLYETYINGHRIGNDYLTPGWTSYHKRLQYQEYDVTSLLQKGDNAVGAVLGSGWYRGSLAWEGHRDIYGSDIALLLQIIINYTDGSSDTIISDGSWKSATGAIRYAEIYNGDIIDARLAKTGWKNPGYDDKDWSVVKEADFPMSNLIATVNEPVRKHEIFHPVKLITTPKGEKVIDFGQNLVGWVIMKVKGKRGDTITLSHAEVLDKYGNFYTANLRSAKAEDIYVLGGDSEETFEPHFTWHGFRYIKIDGYPGPIDTANFRAIAVYSDMEPTGYFSTSDSIINQLQHNIQWGQKGNFLDVPTDCPQRDERLGWTGDAQVFSRTATFNMNANNFFDKWMQDVAADQSADGMVPFVVPNVLGPGAGGSAGWADVATIIPWNVFLAYGDTSILSQQYSSMKAWVEYIRNKSHNNLWNTGFDFGDWLFYSPPDDNGGRAAVTDRYLISQCFYAHSTQLLINAARVLGYKNDVAFYSDLLGKIKLAFMNEYVTPNGRLASNTQTAYVLALQFDMLPENLRKQAAERLVENIASYDNHLTTGFLGTPYLCHVLTRFGYTDVAYKLLQQKTYPSWLYPVTMGATTIWERWDGEKPDSTFETPSMNSFNHYAYGAIGDWMYRKMAGLDTYEDGVGYKHIKIKPHIDTAISQAEASLKTYYGTAVSGWEIDGNDVMMDITIPCNTTAIVYIPASDANDITESGKALQGNIKVAGNEDGFVMVNVGSGIYHFISKGVVQKINSMNKMNISGNKK
jgi:alpha-L-rhamnosidase